MKRCAWAAVALKKQTNSDVHTNASVRVLIYPATSTSTRTEWVQQASVTGTRKHARLAYLQEIS